MRRPPGDFIGSDSEHSDIFGDDHPIGGTHAHGYAEPAGWR